MFKRAGKRGCTGCRPGSRTQIAASAGLTSWIEDANRGIRWIDGSRTAVDVYEADLPAHKSWRVAGKDGVPGLLEMSLAGVSRDGVIGGWQPDATGTLDKAADRSRPAGDDGVDYASGKRRHRGGGAQRLYRVQRHAGQRWCAKYAELLILDGDTFERRHRRSRQRLRHVDSQVSPSRFGDERNAGPAPELAQ